MQSNGRDRVNGQGERRSRDDEHELKSNRPHVELDDRTCALYLGYGVLSLHQKSRFAEQRDKRYSETIVLSWSTVCELLRAIKSWRSTELGFARFEHDMRSLDVTKDERVNPRGRVLDGSVRP